MAKVKCSLSYHRKKIDEIDVFAIGVRDGIYGNPLVFVTPVIGPAVFQASITDFIDKRALYKRGGPAQKGLYDASKELLMSQLDDQAAYTDGLADGDANIINLSGFTPTKGTQSGSTTPVELVDITLTRGSTGEVFAECENQKGVDSYVCILSANRALPENIKITDGGQIIYSSESNSALPGGPMGPMPVTISKIVLDFRKSRRKKFMALTPGVTYYFVFFGINAAGVGPLSISKSIICY